MNVRYLSGLLLALLLLSGCGGPGGSGYSTAQYSIYTKGVPPSTDVVTESNGDQIVGNQLCVTFKSGGQDPLTIAAKYQLGYIVYQVLYYGYYLYVIPDQRSPVTLVQEIAKESTVQSAAVVAASVPSAYASISTAGYSIATAGEGEPPFTVLQPPNSPPIAGNQFQVTFYLTTTTAVEEQIALKIAAKYNLGKVVYPEYLNGGVLIDDLFTIPDGRDPRTLVQEINTESVVQEAQVEELSES